MCIVLFFWTPKLYVNIYSHDCKWEGFTHTPALYRGHRVLKHALFGSNVISLEVTFFDISFDLIFDDKFYFLEVSAQPYLFSQNARGTRAPPGQPVCEQNVWRSAVQGSRHKVRGQQEPWCALHLWGLSHHSCFQREGSEAHADAHKDRWTKTASESGTSGTSHGHSLSLWDVRLFPLHQRGWAAQTCPLAFLFQREALQST